MEQFTQFTKLIEIVEQMRGLSEAYIDCGFLQGREAIIRQYQIRDEELHNIGVLKKPDTIDYRMMADKLISFSQNSIGECIERAMPYKIPEDYVFFLKYYGGLALDGQNYHFSMYGIGPMVEEWYGYFNTADHVLMNTSELGWLSLGHLVFQINHKYQYRRVAFLIDLAGIVERGSVVGIGPWDGREAEELILNDLSSHVGKWKKVSSSFIEWMELALKTNGELGYH